MALARVQKQEGEPLSPKSANIQYKAKSEKKNAKAMVDEEAKRIEAAKKAMKEKEYAPVPPEWVLQPSTGKGTVSEKYRTGKLLGRGGFALAYEGELRKKGSEMNKKVFALKVVRAKMSQRKMEDKFRTELQIHAKMRHPNIVEFHKAFTFKESTYIVLEMCSNGSVMDLVKRRKCLTLPEVRRLTVQLCGAIKYMHTRNVIHRDLKMGNLFLDHDMDLKIGDFGLAAVLVSKDEYEGMFDYARSRRTTLCGTPNYIAPEILEKGKGGHDHKVDIWAIGVILFAMIAGQPPFQSSSQNEIYERARNVDYAWPKDGKIANDVPEEVKDLVARLLKVDADRRPDPDHIVGHSFFSMHGGDAIPARMDRSFRLGVPDYLDKESRPRGDVMLPGTERLSVRTLAKTCGVGYLPGCTAPQTPVGEDIDLSLYKECAAEEAAGLGPIVPLPDNIVYSSKYAFDAQLVRQDIPAKASSQKKSLSEATAEVPHLPKQENDLLNSKSGRNHRVQFQSHAATLRAAPFASKPMPSQAEVGNQGTDHEKPASKARTLVAASARRGLLNEMPVRPTSVASDQISGNLERKPRTTRSKKAVAIDEAPVEPPAEPAFKPQPRRPMTKDEYIDATSPEPDKRRSELAARNRARIASNVQKEFDNKPESRRYASVRARTTAPDQLSTSSSIPQKLIGPDEVVEDMQDSKPDEVLQNLRILKENLEASLSNYSKRIADHDHQTIEAGKKLFKHRPVVVKWVDYTNKFGIGYILANGTVGCIFKGESSSSNGNSNSVANPTCVVVADSETHLKKRKNVPTYPERHQIVHRRGAPVEFIENCGDAGLKRVLCSPSDFQVRVSASGVAEKLGPGNTAFEFEKRRKLCLWDKFGKYMTQAMSKDDSDPTSSSSESHADSDRSVRRRNGAAATAGGSGTIAGPYVKFYQRLGNVGIWGFGDNSLQFNFPDHTKLFISSSGHWADFYHLPATAARSLRQGRKLDAGDLADRAVLSYPLDVMLAGEWAAGDDGEEEVMSFKDVVRENELREKVVFVKEVVGTWVAEGGLGRMGKGRKRGVCWKGIREEGVGKKVWVTVGARGGDVRYEGAAEGE